jgi:Uma2 family endonuclease
MSSAQPNSQEPSQLVRVQVVETVEQLNLRGPMTAEAFEIFASDNGRCELIEGKVNMMSPAGFRSIMSTAQPNSPQSSQLVRAQVLETVEEVNARGPMTAEAFEIFAADNGRCELIEGKVNMMSPAGSEHGYIANEIAFLLTLYVREHKLGRVYAAETGFILTGSPNTVRAPDVAYISKARLPEGRESRGFGKTIPDLVVEVISPSDRKNEFEEKTRAWLNAGVHCVLNVHPKERIATVHRPQHDAEEFQTDEVIDLGDIVDGWKPPVRSFFGSDQDSGEQPS